MIPVRRWPAELLVAPIRFYQRFITPYTPASCRYYPTCSAYAVTALRTRGAVIGTVLTIWRLLRCNPWSEGGIDHVPATGLRWERGAPAGSSTTEQDPEADPPADPDRSPVADPAAASPTPRNRADLSSAPPSRGADTTIRRFAA